jgi:hypothetical protein
MAGREGVCRVRGKAGDKVAGRIAASAFARGGTVSEKEALDELLHAANDITQAAIIDGTQVTVAGGPASADGVAAAADALWTLAARSARNGGTGLERLVVESLEGATYMVTEGERRLVAIAGLKAVPGVVLYDMRACLRAASALGSDA